MRKAIAISLLALFAFNLGGYQLVYDHLANRADQALFKVLDWQQYNEDELITIKQPTHLPYYSSHTDFRTLRGEIDIDGIHYQYVQYRILNDSIELRCIPHHDKMKVRKAEQDYAGNLLDLQQEGAGKQPGSSKKITSLFSEYEAVRAYGIQQPFRLLSTVFVLVEPVPEENGFVTIMEQPPDGRSFS